MDPINNPLFSSDLFITIFLIALFFLALLIIVFLSWFLIKKVLTSQKTLPVAFQKKIFRLSVPREFATKEGEPTKNFKELLSGIENFYANLGGLKAQKGFNAKLFGRNDHMSFEIVAEKDGLISFYMAVPKYLESYLQHQLLSQYPHCQIEEMEDYNIFSPIGYVAAGYLQLAKSNMLPILSFAEMETDPMVGILTNLTKLGPDQTVAIQFVIRSARSSWREFGIKVASKMQQGKNLKDAMKAAGANTITDILGKPSDWISDEKPKQDDYRLSPMEVKMVEAIEKKASKAGFDVNIRIVAFAPQEITAKEIVRQVASSYSQYSHYQFANSFKAVIKGSGHKIVTDYIYRNFEEKNSFVLNTEEMVSLWHLPLPSTELPKLRWLQARKLPPPVNMPQEGIVIGVSQYRGQEVTVKIKDADRRRHMYIIGMTGTGKSYLMAFQAIQDIVNGHGICVVDPHGSLIEDILPYIPKERLEDVVIFDPSDMERPVGLNMLEAKSTYEIDMAAQEMINIFYKLLPDPAMAGPMFEHYMRNALALLMADQNDPGTLVELGRVFTDDAWRKQKLTHVTDILVRDFWEREYTASQKGQTASDMLSYIISKTGRFVENELMRNIIGQAHSGINFRKIMDEGKILLVNLSKGRIGDTNSNLLGLITVSKLQMAALARADMPEDQRKDFYLYIDEFQNFITDSISVILAEARKYKLNLIMGHQFIAQLIQNNDTRVRDAIFGNVGTVAAYRIGVDDAETIAKQLGPKVNEFDVMNTEKFTTYLRLLIDNAASDAFNMKVLNFKDYYTANSQIVAPLKELSRLRYGRDKSVVMREIVERSKIGQLS